MDEETTNKFSQALNEGKNNEILQISTKNLEFI